MEIKTFTVLYFGSGGCPHDESVRDKNKNPVPYIMQCYPDNP